jgi:sentrin-specific protease 1
LPEKLPSDAQALVSQIMSNPRFESKAGRELVAYKDLQRLRPNQWLNDELINFYGQLIVDRSLSTEAGKENIDTKQKKALLKVHYFNTFFWPKVEAGYAKSNLRKWTKKVTFISLALVLSYLN